MTEEPDRIEITGTTTSAAADVPPLEDPGVASRTPSVDVSFSFGSPRPLPPGALSPEAIERLRAGRALSVEDVQGLRAAISRDSGIVGTLLEELLAAGLARQTDKDPSALPTDIDPDPIIGSVPIGAYGFTWRPPSDDTEGNTTEPATEPATYYEAMTGQPDPIRGFFVTARRLLNLVTWIVALGVPAALVVLGVATGEAPETIFFMGLAGLIFGLLFKFSLPKTPFG